MNCNILCVLLHLGQLKQLFAGGNLYLPRPLHKLLLSHDLNPYAFESDGDPQLTTNKIDKEQFISWSFNVAI
jgi:hypothetical protein